MKRNEELPWAGPPKAHLRWPAMLLGVFGASAGLLFVAIGAYALLDYSTTNQKVEIEPPSDTHSENVTRPGDNGQAHLRSWGWEADKRLTSEKSSTATDEAVPIADGTTPSATAEAGQHAKSRQRTFVAQGREVSRVLDQCEQELKLWAEKIQPLLENDLGKKLAGDQSLLRQFRNAYDKDRPAAALAAEFRVSLDDLVAPIQAALDDPQDYRLPRKELVDELLSLQTEVRNLRDTLRKPRQEIEALLSVAAGLPLQQVALRQAMTDQQNAEQLAKSRKIDAEVMQANRDAAEAEAAAAAKIVADNANAEIERQKKEAEHARLVAKAKTREVQQLLTPFISKGYMQYRGGFVRDAEERPMSYKGLLGSGALNPTVQGLAQLNLIATDPRGIAYGNDRPGLWKFVGYPEGWSKSDQDYMKRVQDLLRELAPTLVELKMLAE